jgi:transcription elongation factor GreA
MNYKNIGTFPKEKHFFLTKKGLDDLRTQLNTLRKEQIKMYQRLVKMDAREKAEYIASTDAFSYLENIEQKVMKISDILKRADVISRKKHSSVELGSTVFLESGPKTINYTLVSSIEADPSVNKISEASPLGSALLGKKEHTTFSISTARGKKFLYKVLAIR